MWKQKYCGIVFDESQYFLLLWGQGQKADSVLRKKSKVKQIFCVFVDDSSVVCVY